MSNIVSALTSMLIWTYVVPFGNERLKHFTNTTLHHNATPLSNEEITTAIFFAVLLLIGITFGLAIIVYINKRLHLSTATVMVAAAATSSAVTLLLQFMNLPGADVSTETIFFSIIFSTLIISLYTFFGFFMMFIYLFGIVVACITKLLRSTTVNIVVLASSAAALAAAFTFLLQMYQLIPASSSPRSSSFGYASSLVSSSSCL